MRFFGSPNFILAGCIIAGLLVGFFLPRTLAQTVPPVSCADAFHYSYLSTAPSFDKAYALAPTSTPQVENIRGLLVNHHLLAGSLIAATMRQAATDKPITVVLISPNHFDAGTGAVITSQYQWQTPYGILPGDCTAVADLARAGVVSVEEDPFVKEHGITGIVPFIKKSFPNARVVPLIVRSGMSDADQQKLVDALYQEFGDRALVINSVDFSHYLPDTAAQFHDRTALSVLRAGGSDLATVSHIESNSDTGTAIFLRYMHKLGAGRFTLVGHSNSAELTDSPTLEETTSYLDGVYSIGAPQLEPTATVLAFGDMMLDRVVRKNIAHYGRQYPFANLTRLLMGEDVVVANAEGAFTDNASVTLEATTTLRFTFDPAMLPTLKNLGFTLFSQANNHALNFGQDGLRASQQAINAAGIGTFGDPLNINPGPYVTTIRGVRVAFVAYDQFTGSAAPDDTTVLNAIKQAKAAGAFVIVYPHWGEEYSESFTVSQQAQAHRFVDAGADAVLGAHPHVIEPIEIYRNKAIFYSLGNFIFDQGFSKATSQGLAVGLAITPTTVTYYLFPLNIAHTQASLMPYFQRVTLWGSLASTSVATDDSLRTNIAAGIFTLNR